MTRLRAIVESALSVVFILVAVCILAVTAGVLVGFAALGFELVRGP